MNLRALLRAQGVSARDLDDAVASAREVTELAALGAEMSKALLLQVAERAKSARARALARRGVFLASKVQDGAAVMLRTPQRARADAKPPSRAPSQKKRQIAPQKVQVAIVETKKR